MGFGERLLGGIWAAICLGGLVQNLLCSEPNPQPRSGGRTQIPTGDFVVIKVIGALRG